ncbi:hypothetical protein GQ53DRAFT_809258 [Thozetella sp. PMI_491]|nr:hypothetical protein GQ53DRAFT_809258 [Thozetella sp. PMI_491]
MRSSSVVVAVLAHAALSVATPTLDEIYEVAPLLRRQAPGTAEYQCHYDCGFAIAGGRVAGYCDAKEWKDLYQACLDCANTFDLWSSYGTSVSKAAQACGLTASPSASSATPPTVLPTLPTYAGAAASATSGAATESSAVSSTPSGNSTFTTTSPTKTSGTTLASSSTSATGTTVATNAAVANGAKGIGAVAALAAYLLL